MKIEYGRDINTHLLHEPWFFFFLLHFDFTLFDNETLLTVQVQWKRIEFKFMHCSRPGHANMNDENTNVANFEESGVRVTRARARALGTSGGMQPPLKPSQDQKRALRAKSKRANLDDNKASMVGSASFQHKRRAVLKDVANISCENSSFNNISASKKVQV